jgi:hypothetical protein
MTEENGRDGVDAGPPSRSSDAAGAGARSESALTDQVARSIARQAGEMLGGAYAARLAGSLAERHQGLLLHAMQAGRGFDVLKLPGIESVVGSAAAAAAKPWMTVQSATSMIDPIGVGRAFDVMKLAGIESPIGRASSLIAATKIRESAQSSLFDAIQPGQAFDMLKLPGIESVVGSGAAAAAATPWMTVQSATSMIDRIGVGRAFDVMKLAGIESPIGRASPAVRTAAAHLLAASQLGDVGPPAAGLVGVGEYHQGSGRPRGGLRGDGALPALAARCHVGRV